VYYNSFTNDSYELALLTCVLMIFSRTPNKLRSPQGATHVEAVDASLLAS
jgi:hypothetical protein